MILLSMIFLHIVDDFYLQGWFASAKQKHWWEVVAPDKIYENDYLWALLMHSFSWTFMVMLPLMVTNWGVLSNVFFLCFAVNIIIHAFVDNLKANAKKINLIQDQIIHIVQIILTYMILVS